MFTKPVIDVDQFLDILDAINSVGKELGYKPENIEIMKFIGAYNHKFRQEHYDELEELLYELYERVQTKS